MGCTIYKDGTQAKTGSMPCGYATDNYYAGQYHWTPDSGSIGICRVDISWKAYGSITSTTFTCKIFTEDTTSLNTLIGTSDTVTGVNTWNYEYIPFTFTTVPTLTAGTYYSIVFESSAYSTSNYCETAVGDNDLLSGNGCTFKTDKTRMGFYTGKDACMIIYSSPLGWTHKIMGVSPAKVMGIEKARIAKIMGV